MANRLGRSRRPYRPLADVLVLAGLGAVVATLLTTARLQPVLPAAPTHELLTLCAAGVGTGAAILGVVAARLLDDHRPAWIAAALVLYSAVVLPLSAAGTAQAGGPHRSSMLVVYLTALALMVLSVRPPAVLGAWGCWLLAGLGAVTGASVLVLPATGSVLGLVDEPVLTVGVLIGWTGAAVAFAVAGVHERSKPRLRVGLGLVVVAVAQLYRVSVDLPTPNLSFDGLRLLGLAVVLLGLGQLVARGLRGLQSANWEQQDELAAAATHLERASRASAERDHELRNGLAGLAGITHLLSADPGQVDHEPLRQAVLRELGRLLALVDAEAPGAGEPAGYPVERVLAERVELRASARPAGGGEVELRTEGDLRAAGDPDVLAQVVTNLLVNCDRHAPGAPIAVTAVRRAGEIVVEVRDRGPGLPPGVPGESVLERGARDGAAGGQGLGLHISAELLARSGGRLTLRTVGDPTGCVAEVVLPAVAGITSDEPLVADQRPSAVSSGLPDNR